MISYLSLSSSLAGGFVASGAMAESGHLLVFNFNGNGIVSDGFLGSRFATSHQTRAALEDISVNEELKEQREIRAINDKTIIGIGLGDCAPTVSKLNSPFNHFWGVTGKLSLEGYLYP